MRAVAALCDIGLLGQIGQGGHPAAPAAPAEQPQELASRRQPARPQRSSSAASCCRKRATCLSARLPRTHKAAPSGCSAPTQLLCLPARPLQVKVGACEEGEEEIIGQLSAAGDCVLLHKIGEPTNRLEQRSFSHSPAPRLPAV